MVGIAVRMHRVRQFAIWQSNQSRTLGAAIALMAHSSCHHSRGTGQPRAAVELTPEPLAPSPRLIVGRVIAVEAEMALAFVEIASDAPANALADGTELLARTLDLRQTGRLRASRYVRGRTLGVRITDGHPSAGDEVVWLAP